MKTRIADIARKLAGGRSSTLDELARSFGVSTRTVRNDLKELNAELARIGCEPVVLERGGRVRAGSGLARVLPQLAPQDFYAYQLTAKERSETAALMLVNTQGYLTLSRIADVLMVSRGTVINDLPATKDLIAALGLGVVSHPSRGLRVDGPEAQRREALLALAEHLPSRSPLVQDDASPAAASTPTDEASLASTPNSPAAAHDDPLSIYAGSPKVLGKIVSEQEASHGRWLTGESYQRVVRYLRILVARCGAGHAVEPQDVAENDWFPMASDIVRYVAQYCGVEAGRDEALVLSRLLSRVQYLRQDAQRSDTPLVQVVTRQFIEQISAELGQDLNDDFALFEMLANHLESTMQPSPVSYPDTPTIRRVMSENADVVAAVRRRDALLRGYAGRELTELELGYIVLHICAAIERKRNREARLRVVIACNAGIGTSQLLLEKLRHRFDFELVGTLASHEVSDLGAGDADLVVTTVPLHGCEVESVHVSPLLTDDDVVRIAAKADALRNSKHLPTRVDDDSEEAKGLIRALSPVIHEMVDAELAPLLMRRVRRTIRRYYDERDGNLADAYAPYLHQLLIPSHIALDVEAADWREAVRASAAPLLAEGYIEPRYVDAMIANIEENGPYVVLSKGFAMPHEGLDKGAIETGMSFIRLAHPVPFDADELDPVEFICCLSAADKKTHLKAFFALVNMLRDDDFKRELHEAATSAEVCRILERYEYGVAS